MVDRRRLWGGDHDYFMEIIREDGRVVSRVCQGFAENNDDMKDLVQGVWGIAYEKRRSFRGTGSFAGWLQRLAKNHCTDVYRARKAEQRGLENLVARGGIEEIHRPPVSPDTVLERKEAERMVWDALDTRPEKERDAVVLRLLQRRSPAEVAEEMKIDKASVRSNTSRGIRQLRKMLGGKK